MKIDFITKASDTPARLTPIRVKYIRHPGKNITAGLAPTDDGHWIAQIPAAPSAGDKIVQYTFDHKPSSADIADTAKLDRLMEAHHGNSRL